MREAWNCEGFWSAISGRTRLHGKIALMPPKELEKQTRRERINPRLKAAGWKVVSYDPTMPLSAYGSAAVEEFETHSGPADYALCNDSRALAVVEAKKVTLGPQQGHAVIAPGR
jgi:type I site-specific restriction endonuclease